jgi:hypothetical protein
MPAGRPKRSPNDLLRTTTLREARRYEADLRRILRGEVDLLVRRAMEFPAVRDRPGILRAIERGGYGSAGAMVVRLERDGRNGDLAAGVAGRELGALLGRIRERAGDRYDHIAVFADVVWEPDPEPPRKGAPRSRAKDWRWVELYERLLPAHLVSEPLSEFQRRARDLEVAAIRREYAPHPRDVEYVSRLLGLVPKEARKAFETFRAYLLKAQPGVGLTTSEALYVARRSLPEGSDLPLILFAPDPGLWLRTTFFRTRDGVSKGRETFARRSVCDAISRVDGSVPPAVAEALDRYARRVMADLSREVPIS